MICETDERFVRLIFDSLDLLKICAIDLTMISKIVFDS